MLYSYEIPRVVGKGAEVDAVHALMEEYLSHLRVERGSSPLTVSAYTTDLCDYASFQMCIRDRISVTVPTGNAGASLNAAGALTLPCLLYTSRCV